MWRVYGCRISVKSGDKKAALPNFYNFKIIIDSVSNFQSRNQEMVSLFFTQDHGQAVLILKVVTYEVRKCLHRKTGEIYPLRNSVNIKFSQKSKCEMMLGENLLCNNKGKV